MMELYTLLEIFHKSNMNFLANEFPEDFTVSLRRNALLKYVFIRNSVVIYTVVQLCNSLATYFSYKLTLT